MRMCRIIKNHLTLQLEHMSQHVTPTSLESDTLQSIVAIHSDVRDIIIMFVSIQDVQFSK